VVTEDASEDAREKAILNSLGIPQVLDRRMSMPDSRGTSLSIISVLTGPVTLFGFAMNTGGVSALIWTWLIVSPFVLCVAFSMAEICAAYPISGGCYIWTAKLAKRHTKTPSWLIAGLNGTGNWAGTAFAAVGAAVLIEVLAGLEGWFTATPKMTLVLLGMIVALAGGLNTFAVRLVGWLNRASVWVHVGGVLVITFALLAVPAHHEPTHYVFGTFVNNTGFTGPGSIWYAVALSVLTPMTTLTGFNACGDMAEETTGASKNAPRAMWQSVAWSCGLGLLLVIALGYGSQNSNAEAGSGLGAVAQIFLDALPRSVAVALLVWVILAQLLCVMSCITSGSRMFYSAARDDALPRWLHAVSRRTRVPVRGVWTMAAGAFLFGTPIYLGATQFYAVTSFTATSLFIVYIAPTFLRLIHHRDFRPAAWRLKHPRIVGWVGFGYVCLATVVTLLPQTYPFLSLKSFNWAPVALIAVVLLVLGYYALRGRTQFRAAKQFTAEEIEQLEASVV
jgi:amino acid transporter